MQSPLQSDGIVGRTAHSNVLSAPLNSLMKLNRDSDRAGIPDRKFIPRLKCGRVRVRVRKSTVNSPRSLSRPFLPSFAHDRDSASRVAKRKDNREREREKDLSRSIRRFIHGAMACRLNQCFIDTLDQTWSINRETSLKSSRDRRRYKSLIDQASRHLFVENRRIDRALS